MLSDPWRRLVDYVDNVHVLRNFSGSPFNNTVSVTNNFTEDKAKWVVVETADVLLVLEFQVEGWPRNKSSQSRINSKPNFSPITMLKAVS